LGGRHESSQDLFNLFFRQLVRRTPEVVVLAAEGDRARANGFPSPFLIGQGTTTFPRARRAAFAASVGGSTQRDAYGGEKTFRTLNHSVKIGVSSSKMSWCSPASCEKYCQWPFRQSSRLKSPSERKNVNRL
jgi:hypothetical protein